MRQKLEKSLSDSINWLIRTQRKNGGSAAQFSLATGWSKPYPETTGYIIPTLLKYGQDYNYEPAIEAAIEFGKWLLDIQTADGYWHGGLFPPKRKNPSVFNTGQILFGMHALFKYSQDSVWIDAGNKASVWLANGVGSNGLWESGHYTNFNPTYYTRVAWPMLLISKETGSKEVQDKALTVLDTLLKRQNENGTFKGWGFNIDQPAFTHTMAYTIRGFIESSILIDNWNRYGEHLEKTMNKIYRLTEFNRGKLAGAYDENWKPNDNFSCLTGNAQMAICFMRWHSIYPDLRLINTASKLLEYVLGNQSQGKLIKTLEGAVSGSNPIWGKYMIFRYPNWAAKFYADGIMQLLEIIRLEESNGR